MSARQPWDLSCLDWEARLREGRSLVPDLPLLDQDKADRAVRVFNRLRLADVPGTPTMAEAAGPWFRDIVRAIFGSWDSEALLRYITELFLLVPKKNSKTTNGGLLTLTAFLLNERPRARFALMAPVQDTADIAFDAIAGAIALDEVLEKKLHVRDHIKTIVHRESKAELEIFTFDPDVLTGKKFLWALIDELHVLMKNARAAKAIRQIRGGRIPFPEAFLAFITTMPEDQPVGVMAAELRKARDVRDGKLQAPTLAVLYEFPPAMQKSGEWKDPETWPMVTPNLGRSITIAGLQELYADAASKGEADMRGWGSQHLNLEIGVGLLAEAWSGAEVWEQCEVEWLTGLDDLLKRVEVAAVGVDGGGLDDLLGLYVIGRDRLTKKWLGWGHAWAHPIVLERRKDIAEFLNAFAEAGELTMVEKVGQDVDEVAAIVEAIHKLELLYKVGLDPAGVGSILDALVGTEEAAEDEVAADGKIPRKMVVGIAQGWKMNGAIKTMERQLAGVDFHHGGQGLMAWCVGNARIVPVGNAIRIDKATSGSAKIDPVMAMLNAAHLMSEAPAAVGKSFWERTPDQRAKDAATRNGDLQAP